MRRVPRILKSKKRTNSRVIRYRHTGSNIMDLVPLENYLETKVMGDRGILGIEKRTGETISSLGL